MYKLTNIALHNWYLIDASDIPISGNTAVIGQTGAGKSSILDAIQTIISGNNKNIIELNAAAGTHKSRSVKDYILGCVSDVNEGKPLRKECESTIALTFLNSQTNHYVSFGLFLSCREDKKEDTKRFIIDNYNFKISDFIKSNGKDNTVLPHKDIISHLKGNLLDEEFNLYPSSIKFVEQFLQIMRPNLTPDPKHFLRSFSNTLQAKEMSDTSQFVRKYVLEPQKIDFLGVKESISLWRELSNEVDILNKKITDLEVIHNIFCKSYGNIIKSETNLYFQNQEEIHDKTIKTNQLKIENEKIQTEILRLEDQKKSQDEELYSLLSNSNIDNVKKEVRFEIESNKSSISQLEAFIQNIKSPLKDFELLQSKPIICEILSNRNMYPLSSENDVINAIQDVKLKEDVQTLIKNLQSDISDYSNQLSEYNAPYNSELKSDKEGGITKILKHYDIKYYQLKKEISIQSTEWNNAINTILSSFSDLVIIPSDDANKLVKIIPFLTKNLSGFQLFISNGEKSIIDADHALKNSIKSKNKYVNDTVSKLLSPYSVSNSLENFFTTNTINRNGLVTHNGIIYLNKNNSIFKQDSAIPINVEELQDKINLKKQSLTSISKLDMLLNDDQMKTAKLIINYKNDLFNKKSRLQTLVDKLNTIEDNIDTDYQIRELKHSSSELATNILEHTRKLSRNEEQQKTLNEKITILENHKKDLIELQNTPLKSKLIKEISLNHLTIKNSTKSHELDPFDANSQLRKALSKLAIYASDWNKIATINSIDSDYEKCIWVTKELELLKNNHLLKYQDRLHAAYVEMENSLTEGLINRLGEYFDSIDDQIESLNGLLENYQFVGQKYQFSASPNVRYKPIVDLVYELRQNNELNINHNSEMSKKAKRGIKEIEFLLSDESQDIREFEDYREYYNYELYIESLDKNGKLKKSPFSSVIGKLSGGQRQAPYYVALAASMVATYFPKSDKSDKIGLGLLAFDEAFNKLDIPNTQQLMRLFEELGLQVIVAAPEEKRNSLIECVDNIISIYRKPGTSELFIDYTSLSEHTKEMMKKENPIHSHHYSEMDEV